MIAESSRSPRSGPVRSAASKPLKRGKACSVCRSLKIKCDGVHPQCGPCRHNPKGQLCEWDNGLGKSRMTTLIEELNILRARVMELENPGLASTSVTLHDPYGCFQDKTRSPHIPEPLRLGLNSPKSTTSTHPSGSSASPSRRLISSTSTSNTEEPPSALIPSLIDTFLLHATEFGFFLDVPSFHHSALVAQPFGHPQRPSPALLTTVYLWGVHLTRPKSLQVDERALLLRALHHVATDTLGEHPKRILHTIQANVLLATYFFRTARFLEAKDHLGSAVTLMLVAQMHQQRSSQCFPWTLLGVNDEMSPIYPQHDPQSTVEEGEQINGFWAVLSLHKMISFAIDPAGSIYGALEVPSLQIDTPWPFDSCDYRHECLTAEIQGNRTIRQFLSGIVNPTPGRNENSLNALLAKASILCHRATYLMGQWNPSMRQRDSETFWKSFHSTDDLLGILRTKTPDLPQPGSNTTDIRTLLLIRSLINAAIIKLHSTFSYADVASNQKCIMAASDMFTHHGVDLRTLGAVNSIYGALWHLACTTLIDEISRRKHTSIWSNSTSEDILRHHLDAGRLALYIFSESCTYIRFQRIRIERAYEAINATTEYVSPENSFALSQSS